MIAFLQAIPGAIKLFLTVWDWYKTAQKEGFEKDVEAAVDLLAKKGKTPDEVRAAARALHSVLKRL